MQQSLDHGERRSASPPAQYDMKRAMETSKLSEALVATKAPAFAVLDGAKFTDLPNALIRARLVSRPLYSDRGGQIRDFDQTSPQMVYLDRTRGCEAKAEDGPCDSRILRDVFDLMEDCSAAVLWSCRQGGDALFRHLRKINRVQVEAGHLPSLGNLPIDKHKDDILLFRHADANVMAQIVPALPPELLMRLLGPADAIRFVPDIVWSLEDSYVFSSTPSVSAAPIAGMLRFDGTVMQTIESRRAIGVRRHLLLTFSHHHERMGDDYKHVVIGAYQRAVSYGIETLEDLETFVLTECEYGPQFELRPGHEEAQYMLAKSTKSPAERVYYARRACLDAARPRETEGSNEPLRAKI